jgi:hypothetical protein
LRRTIPIAITLVALGCAACGSTSSSGSADPSSSSPSSRQTTTASYTGPTIPDGTYRYVDRPADVTRVGYPASQTTTWLGADRRAPIIIKVKGLNCDQFEVSDSGSSDLGNVATLRYVGAHRVYMLDGGGLKQLWYWSGARDAVTFRMIKDVVDDAQNDPRDDRFVFEHTFTKVG